MNELLPVGTYVKVTPKNVFGTRDLPYRAKVVGYDTGGTKYRLDPEMWPGEFVGDGICWAFLAEVAAVEESDDASR